MDVVDRIFDLIDKKYSEQKDFANEIGVSPQRVSAWRKRKLASYQKILPRIAEVLGTTTEYLLTGKEPASKCEDKDSNTNRIMTALETLGVSREAFMIALAYDRADEKSRAFARIALSIEGTASPNISNEAM